MPLPNPSMSFSPFAILTAEELNDLVENIEALADWSAFDVDSFPVDSLIPDGSIPAEKLAAGSAFRFLKRTALPSAGSTITVSDIPASKYLLIIVTTGATDGNIRTRFRFNNDSANNYAVAAETPGSTDATAGNLDSITIDSTAHNNPSLTAWVRTSNVASQEKITQGECIRSASGAGNAPTRNTRAGKWANTSDQITRVDVFNSEAGGNFIAGSEVVVFGYN